ncbi:MAG: hypothetical protein A2Y95_00440 [Deltaproteobacteria bacterium RBG_13_65_10]|jgi:hypothetical protein|nr:MAG: hypothetical protein A2Y95_00440 [Deltaproteobacteria bacterium RBG_13_65_10]
MSHLFPAPLSLDTSLTRRGFLTRTVAGIAILLAARVGLRARGAHARDSFESDPYAPKNLQAAHFNTLQALCERIVTPAPGAPSTREARVALRIDHEIGYQGPAFARDLRDALTLIEYGGMLEGKLRPFTRLSPADQDDVIRAMFRSRLAIRRTAIAGLKLAIAFFYYGDDRTWKSTGYDGPWIARRIAETERDFPFPTSVHEKKA